MNRHEFYDNLNKYRANSLTHYGTLGQKWGVRKWQNYDGTFNEAGKERYFGKSFKNSSGGDDKVGGLFTKKKKNKNIKKETTVDYLNKLLEDETKRQEKYKHVYNYIQEKNDNGKYEDEYGEYDDPDFDSENEEIGSLFNPKSDFRDNPFYKEEQKDLNQEQKIGSSYKMSPWEKKAEKNRQKDLDDEYKRNKKSMSKEEFEEWKKETEVKEQKRKSDREEFAKLQDLKENIAKGKTLSEKEYNKLSEEGKKIYDASKEMKEYGWDVESNKDNPDSKYTQRVNLVFTKKLDNKDFGDKFSIHQKDLENISEVNKKADKAIKFLNDKNSYNKIINNLLEDQYKYYQEVTKRENRKNIMTKSEFIESEKPYVKEVGFDTWSGGDGSIAIDFEPKNPNTSWFGYGFEVWVDPNTGKVTDFYQS